MSLLSRTFESLTKLAGAFDFRTDLTVEAAEALAREHPAHLVFENTLSAAARRGLHEHVARGELTTHTLPDQRIVFADHAIVSDYRIGAMAVPYAPSVLAATGGLPWLPPSPSLADVMARLEMKKPHGHAHVRVMM